MSGAAISERRNAARAVELFCEHEQTIDRHADRVFAVLMVAQWVAGIAVALWISPRTWAGRDSATHIHLYAAVFLGAGITACPVFLALTRPGEVLTRHVIAIGQMLTSALLIHLTGGRIETHFHIFGSLATLAFYRDWRVLLTATVVVAADHMLRGLFWPQSLYGIAAVQPWRWLEHAGWVLFEDLFLVLAIVQSRREMRAIAERQANLETVNVDIESQVLERTSELADSETALRVALERAQESDRLKSDFMASMSHEIRTPLNGVVGMTGLLADTDLSPQQRDYAETTRSCADALLTIINDILDFSKIEAGQLAIEPIPFDLELTVEEVVELFASKVAEKDLNLVGRYAPDAPTAVIGDPGRVRQILTNLIGNALKFTEHGHVFVNVECERKENDVGWFRFAVEDTGIGIPEDRQEHVFERFIQADASTTRKYGGTGLGLAISRQLVELMEGTIGVRSQVGGGSTFWFTLPLPLDHERQALPRAPAPDLANIRVLIVDDNAVNRQVVHELVARWGMRGSDFPSGAEGLSALRRARIAGDPFQIALVDLYMPAMDGETFARAVKSDPEIRDTVLLLLTSGSAADGKRMADAGFAAYLSKPVRPNVLMDALATTWASREHPKEAVLITRHSLADRIAAPPSSAMSGPPPIRGRVLLVDDNIINQKVARLILERLGCRVDAAANGREAVQMVTSIPYDIVFMDCQMPEMDGYEATREIRRVEKDGVHLPIVAMTAAALTGDREKCLEAGMDDYMSKPVRPEGFQRSLHQWLPPQETVRAETTH